jgi:hypothetical protein
MARREAEGNHILLAVALPFAELLDSLVKSPEEFATIYHPPTFTWT